MAGLVSLLFAGLVSAAGLKESARDLDALEQHKDAELALWRAMTDIYARRALLVTGEPLSFGVYTPRKDNRYLPGEPVHIYVEPVGHTIREEGGLYTVSLALDFTLMDESGKLLGGQRNYDRLEMKSRRPVMEFMAFFTYDTEGLAAGRYIFETLLRDSFADRNLKVAIPVVIVDQAGVPSPGHAPDGEAEAPGPR